MVNPNIHILPCKGRKSSNDLVQRAKWCPHSTSASTSTQSKMGRPSFHHRHRPLSHYKSVDSTIAAPLLQPGCDLSSYCDLNQHETITVLIAWLGLAWQGLPCFQWATWPHRSPSHTPHQSDRPHTSASVCRQSAALSSAFFFKMAPICRKASRTPESTGGFAIVAPLPSRLLPSLGSRPPPAPILCCVLC